jgi:hypothetical protein
VFGADVQAARGRRKRPKDQSFCAPSPESTHRLKKTNNFKTQVFDRKNTQTHPNKFASYVGRCPVIIKSTCDRPAGRRGPKTVAKEAGEIADSHSSQPTTLCRFRAFRASPRPFGGWNRFKRPPVRLGRSIRRPIGPMAAVSRCCRPKCDHR